MGKNGTPSCIYLSSFFLKNIGEYGEREKSLI
jgi:hypothetical protein